MANVLSVTHFSPWATVWVPTDTYLREYSRTLPAVSGDPKRRQELMRMALLDRAWHAEVSRCFGALQHPALTFQNPRVTGPLGLSQIVKTPPVNGETRWMVFAGQDPAKLGPVLGQVLPLMRQHGWRFFYYSFDEATRRMPAFAALAPYLDVLVHDERPLDPEMEALLRPDCRRTHRSWVANLVPGAATFHPTPEPKILFLGSQLGLTPHRQRQLTALQAHFKDRFVAIHDHSVSVADRLTLGRYQVAHCPEGRMFASAAMSRTHTDRPFWSGCLGMVPVSEDSASGGRLDDLATQGLLERYRHGDLPHLIECCERALGYTEAERRRLFDHYNAHETVGAVVARELAALG